MKRAYMKPTMRVVKIQQQRIICTSDWDVIGSGQPNQPAGARQYNGFDDWDE